jgi:hypothetical protein
MQALSQEIAKTRQLNINIPGRVKKVKTSNFLVPLFEAISNSIHAIDDSHTSIGNIKVEIIRKSKSLTLKDAENYEEDSITGFVISDTGSGFTDSNMNSFCEADSTHKAKRGGKGVGRFSWLKFFNQAKIESTYCEPGSEGEILRRRSFTFSAHGIGEEKLVDIHEKVPPATWTQLSPIKPDFETKTRKAHEDVARAIVEHFTPYLVTNGMPPTVLWDGVAKIDILDLYARSIGKNAVKMNFRIDDFHFDCVGLRIYSPGHMHAAQLCADKRVAEKVYLSKLDTLFAKRFQDENLDSFAYHIYVESPYLDAIVSDDRDGFQFPNQESADLLGKEYIAHESILKEILGQAKSQMLPEIEKVKSKNLEKVTDFVHESAPQYRYLISKNPDAVSSIYENDPQKIDLSLRRIQFEEEIQTKLAISSLLSTPSGEIKDNDWIGKSNKIFEKLNDAGKASLASYIVQRKMILDLLEKRLEISDGSYSREEAIHQLIFPMRTTSDELSYESQNLWILDERLSYHHYLASDKPLKSIDLAGSESRKEPDILIFNRPIALNDRPDEDRLESVAVIEFKRPGKSPVDGEKNPVDQVLEYIELIIEGRAFSRKGRPIQPTNATYFFGYVVCELDERLKKALSRMTMSLTPDGRGMSGYFKDPHKAYIEVISYDKMLSDANKRNRILFDKLQIPAHRN